MAGYNDGFNKRRERIHQGGVPTFGKRDVSTGFNCLGCRKRKEGFRMMVTYKYEKKNNPDIRQYYIVENKLGMVCSDVCYDMAVMRFS